MSTAAEDITTTDAPEARSHRSLVLLVVAVVLILIGYTQLTFFVVPPIGAVPDGVTLVMLRGEKTQFIDSADALCERNQGGVSLLCRGIALGAVGKNATILARLPYSSMLYSISTGGKTYSR
jgi:hypothetical protein